MKYDPNFKIIIPIKLKIHEYLDQTLSYLFNVNWNPAVDLHMWKYNWQFGTDWLSLYTGQLSSSFI